MLQKAAKAKYEDGSPVYRLLGEEDGLKPLMIDTERAPMEARPPEHLPDWETIAANNLEEHVLAGKSVWSPATQVRGKPTSREQ